MAGVSASAASGVSASKLLMHYSMSLTKKAMDSQEDIASNLVSMMKQPQPQLQPAKGQYIDVYA